MYPNDLMFLAFENVSLQKEEYEKENVKPPTQKNPFSLLHEIWNNYCSLGVNL